jgi:hypothetical protein
MLTLGLGKSDVFAAEFIIKNQHKWHADESMTNACIEHPPLDGPTEDTKGHYSLDSMIS